MKKIFENWRKQLNETKHGRQLSEFIKPDGTVRLYHFSSGEHTKGDSLLIDPALFPKKYRSYSANEYNRSAYPRSFYYTDLSQIETSLMGGNELFFVDVPAATVYDFKNDETLTDYWMRHRDQYGVVNWDKVFEDIKNDYGGMYYTLSRYGPPIVVYFSPLEAQKMEIPKETF